MDYNTPDNFHQVKESFYVVLDSRNATGSENDIVSYHSNVFWDLKEPIRIEKKYYRLTCNLCSFVSPASFYQINYTNNIFNFTMNSIIYNVVIVSGNYNANTFITQLLSQLPVGFSMTINTNNNIFTLTHTTYDFVIDCTKSTIGAVLGFNSNNYATLFTNKYTNINSISKVLLFPYTCNFSGLQSFNVSFEDINTKNIDSLHLCNSSIICAVPVDCSIGGLIAFQSRNEYEFSINQDVIDYIQISLKDDLGNYLDLNNQHFNLVLQFNLYGESTKRDMPFHHILQNPYPQFEN